MADPAPPMPAKSAYRRGATALGTLVPEAVAPVLKQRGFASAAVLTEWRAIVGPHLAGWTTPIIACPGAFALDVQMSARAIIEAVNRRVGFACIGAIQIHQAPRPAPKPAPVSRTVDPALIARIDQTLGDIEQADLRRALAELGASIAARTPG